MHTEEEMRIIQEYEKSVDEDIYRFVKDIMEGNDRINCITVAFLSEKTAKEIADLTGKNVEGNRVVLDINAVKHIQKRHGENGENDDSMKNIEDIARMGYVLFNYDEVKDSGRVIKGYLDESGRPAKLIEFSKRIDGIYYVIEAVNSSKAKKNYVITAYISKKKKQSSDH